MNDKKDPQLTAHETLASGTGTPDKNCLGVLLDDLLCAQAKATHGVFCDLPQRIIDIRFQNKHDAINSLLKYVCGLEKQLADIKNREIVWISIKDKVPSDYHEVLVHLTKTGCVAGYDYAYRKRGRWYYEDYCGDTEHDLELDGFEVDCWTEFVQPDK